MSSSVHLSLLLTCLLHCHVEGILCEHSLKFGENHSFQLNITSPQSLCYQLNQTTQKQALRVYAASDDAVMDHPVLVTARQCKGVTSWSVPFVESGLSYGWFDHMLCPFLNMKSNSSLEQSEILVDLSTSSLLSINITLRIDIVEQHKLELHKPLKLDASSCSASYLLFEYPPDLNDVRVKITSDADTRDICAIASIQNVYCPVVELVDNVDDRGMYQTMRSLAAFNVETQSEGRFFYVVLSVYPDDCPHGDCDCYQGLIDRVSVDNHNPTLFNGSLRVKRTMVTVQPALTTVQYAVPMALLLILIVVFYTVTIGWIVVFDWWKYDEHPMYTVEHADVEKANHTTEEHDGKATHGQATEYGNLNVTLSSVLAGIRWKRKALNNKAARKPVERPTLWSVLSGSNWDEVVPDSPSKPSHRKNAFNRRNSSASVSSNQSLSSPLHSIYTETYPSSAFQSTTEIPTDVATLRQRKQVSEVIPGDIEEPGASDVAADTPFTPSPTHSLTQHTTFTPSPTHSLTPSHELHFRDRIPDTIQEEESDSSLSDEEELIETYQHDKPPFPVKVLVSELGEIDEYQSAYDHYYKLVLAGGLFYAMPVYQLLIVYRSIVSSGNENVCYHNFLCAHPWRILGVSISSFNTIFSNVVLFSLGLLIILISKRRKYLYYAYAKMNLQRPIVKRIGVPQQFGIFYTIGVTAILASVMSSAYHMCPTKDNYKFDASFILISQGIGIQKIIMCRGGLDKSPPVHDIMLFIVGILYMISIGTTFSSSTLFWGCFFLLYVLLTLLIAVEFYYRWQINSSLLKQLLSYFWSEGIYPPRHKRPSFSQTCKPSLEWQL
ncbi:SID1 transmembrane family member 1-like isoform X3 [Halichondria panicea]|uniref:SID1 transmembrane family member 1-like isoform X3 n=1 Tax=Halichondria panicea TaxID=6063 RepID=UPI00312B8139